MPTNSDYELNLKLSYDYLEKSIKEIQDVINNTNGQLGILIGFSFTFIRFFINELPGKIEIDADLYCNSCFWCKILAYGLAIASITFCFLGLYQSTELKIVKPKVLIENCDRVINQELKLAIIDMFEAKLENFSRLAARKKQFLNLSIILLLISGLMAILDEVVAAISA
ncbi:MAG: hypothetical protein AAFR77_19760 [Cyanobacteria bacterium J06631_2]